MIIYKIAKTSEPRDFCIQSSYSNRLQSTARINHQTQTKIFLFIFGCFKRPDDLNFMVDVNTFF